MASAADGSREPGAAGQLDGWVELGHVNGVFGVGGWIKVFSFTRPREAILEYRTWHLVGRDGARVARQVLHGRLQGVGVVAKLARCEDRNTALDLVGSRILVPASDLAEPDAGEYYWRDLVGLEVVNLHGESFGRVGELLETGANDVLVMDGDDGLLVPFTREVVREVDLEAGRIVVDWDRDY